MKKKYLAGIDIGTTGAKTIIFDLKGNPVGSGYREYKCTYPKPNWVEQDPANLLAATMESSKEAVGKSGVDPDDIASIAVSAQRCSSIFIDKAGVPLKMISWQDNRTGLEVDQIQQKITADDYYKVTGLPLNTTWILTKILWMRNNRPDIIEKTHKIVQVHDFILKALGADDYYVDEPDACFYGTWNTDGLKWDKNLMKMFNIQETVFSKVRPSGTMVGEVSKQASEKTGFAAKTPLCIGAGDQNCAAVGAGIVRGGKVSVSIGTGGMAIAFLDRPYRDPMGQSMVTNHAIHGKWQLEGYQAGAAGVYRWFRDEIATLEKLQADETNEDVYNILNEMIENTPVGAKGLVMLPYFASATAPRWNPNARGTLMGLTFAHDRGCIARAFVEGITMEQKDIIQSMLKTGINVDSVRIMGGATKSDTWNQIQADMYNLQVETLKVTDAAVLGAAICAGVGVGIYSSIEEAASAMVAIDKSYQPIRKNVEIYNSLYDVYCKAYQGLSSTSAFDSLAKVQEGY